VFGLGLTLVYIYPINAVLFGQAGGDHPPEEVRAMADRWILADRIRFAAGFVGFLVLLRAFRLPIPSSPRVKRAAPREMKDL